MITKEDMDAMVIAAAESVAWQWDIGINEKSGGSEVWTSSLDVLAKACFLRANCIRKDEI